MQSVPSHERLLSSGEQSHSCDLEVGDGLVDTTDIRREKAVSRKIFLRGVMVVLVCLALVTETE